MDFSLNSDETSVIEAAAQLATGPDPWGALLTGGWLDLLADGDTDPAEALGYLGLVAEELGAAGIAVPLIGTAVVWPTLFKGTAGGRKVAVAAGPVTGAGPLLAEDGGGADAVIAFSGNEAAAFGVASASPASGEAFPHDGLAWVTQGDRLEVSGEPERVAEAQRRAAAVTAAEMAGALRQVSAMTVGYVTTRQQFGRPVSAFQAVAHGAAQLAVLSEGAIWAARAACRSGDPADTHAAKGWVSQASQEVSALAHQLHGAIGFTEEYGLQQLTKRLRALRFAYGDDRNHWAALGRLRRSS